MNSYDHTAQIIDLGDACLKTHGNDTEGPIEFQTLLRYRIVGISEDD